MKLLRIESAPKYVKRHPTSGRFYLSFFRTGHGQIEESLGPDITTLKGAIRKADLRKAEILTGATSVMAKVKTVQQVGDEVFATKINRKPKTLADAELHIYKHLIPWFMDHYPYVEDITEIAWEKYISYKRSIRPDIKFFPHHKYLRMILKLAYDSGYMKRRIKIVNPDLPTKVGKEYTDTELKALLKRATKDLNHQILLAIHAGMRKGEILGLHWDRVDFSHRTLTLLPADTKTKRGREFPFTEEVAGMLLARWRRLTSISPFVFPSRYDNQAPSTSNKTAWKRAKREAKVTGRFHDLRHTFVRRMLDAGIAPIKVAKYTGMSLQVLDRVYGQLKPSQMTEITQANSGKFRELIK